MKKNWLRTAALVVGCTLGALAAASPSEARSHSHFSVNIGVGGYYGHGPYWGPSYYWSAPVYAPGYYYGWQTRPYYDDYAYAPSYAPSYYDRAAYSAPVITPTVALDLFPAPLADRVSGRTQDIYFGAYREALAAPVGNTITWSDGGVSGGVTTTRDGWAGQRYCREFRQTVSLDGRNQEATGTACRDPNGSWQLVPNQR